MKITIDLLKEWGACERALAWFEKDYPDGVDAPVKELCDKVIPAEWREYDSLWLLHEVAARVDGVEGDEALALLVERADMDSVAKGEKFRLKITRDAASDTATGDLELHAVEVREATS